MLKLLLTAIDYVIELETTTKYLLPVNNITSGFNEANLMLINYISEILF